MRKSGSIRPRVRDHVEGVVTGGDAASPLAVDLAENADASEQVDRLARRDVVTPRTSPARDTSQSGAEREVTEAAG